jgi:tetratricopeptide (TPR) repeat protein
MMRIVLCLTTIAALTVPAFGDEELEALVAKAASAANDNYARMFENLLAKPSDETLYCMCGEHLYNLGKRDLALALLELGVRKAQKPARVLTALRAIYRYELDLPQLEKSYADELDQAIKTQAQYLPQAVFEDKVMTERLRPRYLAVFKTMPEYKGLLEFLRQACKDPAAREQLLRIRLAAVEADQASANELLSLLLEQRKWELLAAGGADMPKPVQQSAGYPQVKAQALLELGKKEQAIKAADDAAKQLPTNKFAWRQVAGLYAALGNRNRAVEIVKEFATPGDHKTALALAEYGDSEGAMTCVQQVIDRDAPGWVMFQCVDACRKVGLNKRAEEVFAVAQAKCLKELARNPAPGFNFPHEIRYRYLQEGRHERLLTAFAQALPGKDKELLKLLEYFTNELAIGGQVNDALALAGPWHAQHPDDPGFMLLYAELLERAGKRDQADEIFKHASTMPTDSNGMITPLNLMKSRYQNKMRAAAAASRSQPASASAPVTAPAVANDDPAGLETLAAKSPRDGSLRARLGLALFKAGKIEDGRREVRLAVQLGYEFAMLPEFQELPSCLISIPPDAGCYGRIAAAYLDAERTAEFEKDFQPLLSRTPAHRAAHLQTLARWLETHKRWAEAVKLYLQLKDLDPYRATFFQEMADAAARIQSRPS